MKNILFFSGVKETLFFSDFAVTFGKELQSKGIFCPLEPRPLLNDGIFYQTYQPNELTADAEDTLLPHLLGIRKNAEAADAQSIILGISAFRPSFDSLFKLATMCRILFPKAKQSFFIDYTCPDDLLLEIICGSLCFSQSWKRIDEQINFRIDHYPAAYPFGTDIRKLFSFFGPENVYWGGEHAAIQALRHITDFSLPHKYIPKTLSILPREFLYFAMAINRAFVGSRLGSSPPWATQLAYFPKKNASAPTTHRLLSPAQRLDFFARCSNANVEAAKIIGLEQLYPAPELDIGWKPFSGLTYQEASRYAALLDHDFARTCRDTLDVAPYLDREQRVVQQALHEGGGSTKRIVTMRNEAKPKLSVLTLTYNHAPFIQKNIESVLSQHTSFPVQHIIVDDGSSDGTRDIVLEYASKHPHITPLILNKNVTMYHNNVHCLFDMARSEYVALCDGDDYFTDPNKLQVQADYLDKNAHCALCFHPVRVTYENNPKRERFFPPPEELPGGVRPYYDLDDLIRFNFIQTNSVVYRWRFADMLPDWFRPDLCPGDWYWHLLHAETGKIGFIDKVMSVYRRHSGSIYYLSEVDRLKHRATRAMGELITLGVINSHFDKKYEPVLQDMANGVFADCLQYDMERAEHDGSKMVLAKLCDLFPDFARHFLGSLKLDSVPARQ